MLRFVGQIGVLGWMIVAPTLLGLFIGRWLDRTFGSGIFWSAGLLVLGVTIGFWSAWKWMHRQ
jgi:ATP synthase protein I